MVRARVRGCRAHTRADRNVLNLAKSEVQIQYQYGENFQPRSVLIITWENVAPRGARDDLPIDVGLCT
jgi:hypothetical protein